MGKKLEYSFIKKYFDDNGCVLLETEYKNNNTKMRYICSCGNESEIKWKNFQKGHRCIKCSGTEKHTFEYVQNYFKKQGCDLLETEYKNSKILMKYRCSCGNISKIRWNDFLQKHKCKKCGIIKESKENHYKWNPDREYIKNKNIISDRCKNMLRNLLKKLHIKKLNKTEIYLGYSRQELYEHLTSHPNWNKVKNLTWDIDHIFPISAFLKIGINDPKIINSLDNLQPLEHIENLKKRDKYNKKDFLKFIKEKSIEENNI